MTKWVNAFGAWLLTAPVALACTNGFVSMGTLSAAGDGAGGSSTILAGGGGVGAPAGGTGGSDGGGSLGGEQSDGAAGGDTGVGGAPGVAGNGGNGLGGEEQARTGGATGSSSGGSAGFASGGNGGSQAPDLSGAYDLVWGDVLVTPAPMIQTTRFGFSRGKSKRLELRRQAGSYLAAFVGLRESSQPIVDAPVSLVASGLRIDLSQQVLTIPEDVVENCEKSNFEHWTTLSLELDAGGNLTGTFSALGHAFTVPSWSTDISMSGGTVSRDPEPPVLAWEINPERNPPFAPSYSIEFGGDTLDPAAVTAGLSASLAGPRVPAGTTPSITPRLLGNWSRVPAADISLGDLTWTQLMGARLRISSAAGIEDVNGNAAAAQERALDFPDLAARSEIGFDQGLGGLATWGSIRLLTGATCESGTCLGIAPCDQSSDHGLAAVIPPNAGSTLFVRCRWTGNTNIGSAHLGVTVMASDGTQAGFVSESPSVGVDWHDFSVALPPSSEPYLVSLNVSWQLCWSRYAPDCSAPTDILLIDRVGVR